ncbi:hypothetical protein LOK46_10495 [Methylobacterium sp. NMS14P]|uniref:hypothetical protein n=1 Tax=Methylobacterium sp. NMS14P TaxID=2894310 RepID=UPI0023586FDF|nr:hypothetical protein [Methylobacterium sp. NMS14P]WCS27218.1 hypothetical protein LOK46_10495 [Methylobacterium sp. NMS14P]
MTQILNLPQFDGTQSVFSVVKGAGWYDTIMFSAPGSPAFQSASGALTSGSATVAGLPAATVAAIVPGQLVTGFGIPAGTIIAAVPSTTSITLSAAATVTDAAANLAFQPMPLDLTGIAFDLQVRLTADSPVLGLDISTAAATMVNGGTNGQLAFNVPPSSLNGLTVGTYTTDIVATADGRTINLFQTNGPASLIVRQGVTR